VNINQFKRVLSDRRNLVLAVIVISIACLPFLAKVIKPTYVAVSELSYVGSGSPAQASSLTNAILPTTDLPDLVMSSRVLKEAMHRVGYQGDVDDLRLALSVKSSPHSDVVPVSVHLKDAALAVALANSIADSAVDQYKAIAEGQYDEVIDSLGKQMRSDRDEIRKNDALLQRSLQSDYSVGSADSLDNISKHLDDLETQRAAADATFVADGAAMNAQVGGSAADRAGLANAIHEQVLTNDPQYQAVKAVQSKDAAQLVSVKAGYTDAFPGLTGLEEQVRSETAAVKNAERTAIAEHPGNSATYAQVVLNEHNAAALAAGDKARLVAIDGDIASARAKLTDLPRVGVDANMYRLRRDSASAAYEALETRYQQTLADRAQASALGTAIVLDHAIASYPRIPQIVMAGIITLLIFGLAIGVAYFAEYVNPRIRTATEVEDLYGTPRIGSV
jgi:uncharacterized protein involved in exopolysaccharide biosynthesis